MSSVELVRNDLNTVIIKTNEGLMERSSIPVSKEGDGAQVTFDESYKAGRATTVTSRHTHYFTPTQLELISRLIAENFQYIELKIAQSAGLAIDCAKRSKHRPRFCS